jgi:H+/Cl- antiporter ClcA
VLNHTFPYLNQHFSWLNHHFSLVPPSLRTFFGQGNGAFLRSAYGLVRFSPEAAGSGLPEVKCILSALENFHQKFLVGFCYPSIYLSNHPSIYYHHTTGWW